MDGRKCTESVKADGEKGDWLTMRSCPDTVGGQIISRAVREEECEHAG